MNETVKTCGGPCKRNLPLSDYYKMGLKVQSYCKKCNLDNKNAWRKKNSDKVRWNKIWSRFRLREIDWLEMYEAQGGLCAVCMISEATHIDHDHTCCDTDTTCGECVRGLVCNKCNTLLGRLESDENITRLALEYIRNHKEQHV